MPNIILVGSWMWPWYQEACARALRELGCRVDRFSWLDDFYQWVPGHVEPVYKSSWARLQNRFLVGPALMAINKRLLKTAVTLDHDVIWFYNCTHIFPGTIRQLRRLLPQTVLVQYVNDNPFGAHVKPDYWRYLKRSIPEFDVHFIFRRSNEPEFLKAGARSVHLLRPYYLPWEDCRVDLQSGDERYLSDVVFAGHYEPDGRMESLEAIAAAGYHLKLFGGGWMKYVQLSSTSPLRSQLPIEPVVGDDYRKAISGAKIALCFLSKINRDTCTRRNFEIPAMQTFMLGEYTDDLAALFAEGVEAEFFRSREEMLEKIKYYLCHNAKREQIACNGYHRVQRDGQDVFSRMKQFLAVVSYAIESKRTRACR
jgi:hypothetical protein